MLNITNIYKIEIKTMKYHFISLDCLWAPQTSMRLQAEKTTSLQT